MNLSSLNLLKHPHIVQLLGSYTHRKRHNFIFPQARGGCLQDLFEQERPREFIKDEDVLVALSRLASAISHVHDFFVQDFSLSKIGCHHDLRPSNILVDEDRFILADFGLSRFKEQNDGSATEFKIGKGYCLAPECQDLDNDFERHEIHRSSDIWSFGCIVADLLTWMVKGPSGITEFKQKRRTTIGNHIYYYFHSGLCANPGVEKWLADLENTCATSVKMLISLTRRMLDIEPDLRPSAKEVAVYTRFIALNAIFLRTSQNFQDIQQRSFNPEASIEPLVESRRFSSWGWALEIDSDTIHIPKSSPQIDLGFDGFQSAISLLRMLRLELDSIKSQAPNGYKRILMPLRHINTSLMKLLPHHAQARAIRYVEREVLQTESPIQLEKLQHVYPNDHIKVLASARKSTLFIGSVSQYKERALEMQHEPVLGTSQLGHHIIGSLHPISSQDTCQVLVELKSYEDPFLRERLFHRMEGIARLSSSIPKPDKLRILHCRGYFHDKVRSAFGLVYDFPTLAISNGQKSACSVVSLRHILDAQLRNQQPTLGQRFKLAYDLASAISSFGKIGWFHKGLSSSAIAFFYQQESSFEASSMDPYLIGFRHSRPHDIVTFTEGPSAADPDERYYQHPQYLQENVPYSFIHEYYSLGVVLLEIGLWKPVL